MTEVYLMTSGELYNKDDIIIIHDNDNRKEVDEKAFLSVGGEKEVERLSKNPKLQSFDAIYSSNFIRSLETAKYIALENNTIIHIDDRFNERIIGDIEPMEVSELRILQAKNFDFKLPNGESLNEVKKKKSKSFKGIT